MLTAFIDDSGSEGQGPVFVLAGHLSRTEVWSAFATRWQQVLDEAQSLPYFKMKEAHRLHDVFPDDDLGGRSKPATDERLKTAHHK